MANVFQYDDVTVSLIPSDAKAVLGYSDGLFDNRSAMTAAFPKAVKTFLTVHGNDFTADGVDSERGDASTADVIEFNHAKHAQNVKPVDYTFLANMETMYQACLAAGFKREDLILMCAHVTGVPHICGPQCGFGLTTTVDATQYTFTAEGRSLDESLCAPSYFARSLAPPKPVDPNHYNRFGKYRHAVEAYDGLRRHRVKNRQKLADIQEILLHASSVTAAHVIHEAPKKGTPARKAAWNKDFRWWRYPQLVNRANGKRVVK